MPTGDMIINTHRKGARQRDLQLWVRPHQFYITAPELPKAQKGMRPFILSL